MLLTYFIEWAPLTLTLVAILSMLVITTKMIHVRNLRVPLVISWAVLALSAIIGFLCIYSAAETVKRNQIEKLSSTAKIVASSLEGLDHASLSVDTDPDDPVYQKIMDRMYDWLEKDPSIASVYTLVLSENEEMFFICEPACDFDKSGKIDQENEQEGEIGSLYGTKTDLEELPEFVEAFSGRSGFNPVPSPDKYGIWITATEPILDENGNVSAIVGIDFWGERWISEMNLAKIWPILFYFSFFILFFSVQIFLIKRQASEEKIADYAVDLENALEELVEAKREADAATQAKGYFLANMSHEIKTPMNAILGCVDMLNDSGEGKKAAKVNQTEIIDLIRKSSKDLLTIIDDILTFSSLDSNRIQLESAEIAPRQVLDDVIHMLQPRLKEKPEIEFQFDWLEPIPAKMLGDSTRIRQLLINLIGNAIKFTDRGYVIVRCSTRNATELRGNTETISETGHHSIISMLTTTFYHQPNRDDTVRPGEASGFSLNTEFVPTPGIIYLQIEISDTGIGMTPEVMNRLFKPFSQADDSYSRRYGGTGLGLGIARGIAGLMGGEISVFSESGKGSTFTVFLPIRLPSDTPGKDRTVSDSSSARRNVTSLLNRSSKMESEQATGVVASPKEKLPLFGFHILVVDDSVVNQLVAASKLKDAGADVDIASDGRMAIEKVDMSERVGYGYNTILMDMQMPIMDGFEATKQLRKRGFKFPIIAASANFDIDKDAKNAGCNVSLSKPLNRDELIETIIRLTRS